MARETADQEVRLAAPAAAHPTELSVSGYSSLVLDRLSRHTCRIADVSWSCLFVRDKDDPRLVIAAAGHGIGWDLIGTRFGADEGVIGRVLRSGVAMLLEDFRDLALPLRGESDAPRGGVAVPIRVAGAVDGVLAAALGDSSRSFNGHDLELLAELADLAAGALGHAQRRTHRDTTVHAHVEALAAAIAMRDRLTASHSDDVVELSQRVGGLLELEPASLLELEFAARLHDIGKIKVPDAVLNKAGPLDHEESGLIRCHATWGADTLARIPGLEAVATIVRYHHERWDGHGYPDGLSGARIPLASRIIAVCDAFGAMTSDRPYRRAIERPDALGELRAGAGSQFDPSVVEALVEAVGGTAKATS